MKPWQIFLAGCLVLIAIEFLPAWETLVVGVVSVLLIAAVVIGFMLRQRKHVFIVRTNVYGINSDGDFFVEHDRIAVRVDVARLWLLFLPTILGIAFLLITSASGTTWHFSLFDIWEQTSPYVIYFARIPAYLVFAAVWVWVTERWVLNKADRACISPSRSGANYSFIDESGSYYGGEAFPFNLAPAEVADMVFYDSVRPETNKIGRGFLYHRFAVVGYGITDLDEETAEAYRPAVQET